MFSNYIKTAWRNLWRHKGFTIIHIVGLSVGIAAFLLIVNYLRFEFSYDEYNSNYERIYRVPMVISEKDGKAQTFAFTYPAVAPALKKDFPEIEEVARFRKRGGIVQCGDQKFLEGFGDLYYADPAVFRIFSFHFIEGDSASALAGLENAVLTASAARKYFGKSNPLGKMIRFENENFVIKAVIEDLPQASHIQFDVLLNYNKYVQVVKNYGSDAEGSWHWSDFYTYVLLKKGADIYKLRSRLPAFATRYLGDDMKKTGYSIQFHLQPLKDIHLRSKYDYELTGNGDLGYLNYLGIAALFLLGIAWINYINLSTARAMDRSREVGVRKVIGASRFQLIRQFLSESFLLNILAILIGWMLFRLFLPYFSTLVEKKLDDLLHLDVRFWLLMLFIFILGSLLAGFYPSFVLSSFQPVRTLKSGAGSSGSQAGGKQLFRKSLVVLQFCAAIVLIASAIGYYRQLRFMQQVDLGVDIKQTLVLQQTASQDSSKIVSFDGFINDLEKHPGIRTVTASTSVPGEEVGGSSGFRLINSEAEKRCRVFGIDDKFIPAYGLKIVAGRTFERDRPPVDSAQMVNVILNEAAAKVFGFNKAANAVGARLEGGGFHCQVVGVLGDYHQESLRYGIDPIVFYPGQETDLSNFSAKLETRDLPAVMKFAKEKWNARFPESPFTYFFLDDHFNAQYKNDRLFAEVLWIFTGLAILIACMGLFGLSLYTISKRSREISIRKVLGASMLQICALVTRDYLKLVLLAAMVAIPLGWILLQNWIGDYAYRITIGWWFIVWPLLSIATIAILTVLYQSLKAASSNPARNLRSE